MATRATKYPETEHFHYLNVNPHGRKSDDCVIRAVSYFLGQSWEKTIRDLTEIGIKHGYVCNDMHTVEKYLSALGYEKQRQPRKTDNTKYYYREFARSFSHGVYLVSLPRHLTVCDNGVNIDIWDCYRFGKSVGNVWYHD